MVSFVTDQPVLLAGGQTVINRGPSVVFYGPTAAVRPDLAAGSVAVGASYTLSGATWFVSAKAGAVSTVSSGADYGPPVPAQSGSAIADYVVSKDGTKITATPVYPLGRPTFTGTDAYTVIQGAISALTVAGGGVGSAGGRIDIGPGEYGLSDELTVTGWENAAFDSSSQLMIQGAGRSTYLVQNTAGKNGFAIRNAASVVFRDFRMYAGASARSCIRADKAGATELSMIRSVFDNLYLRSASASYPAAFLQNFMELSVPYIQAENYNNSGLVLENDSTTVHYGNSNFGLLRVAGSTDSPHAGLIGRSVNASYSMNLITIENLECIRGYYGLYTKGLKFTRIAFVDIEGVPRPVYFDGDNTGIETRHVEIESGYIQCSGANTAITQSTYTGGNRVRAVVNCDANTVPIDDQSQYRPVNDYDILVSNATAIGLVNIAWRGGTARIRDTNGGVLRFRYANNQGGAAYTLEQRDSGGTVETTNASANTVTVPPNSAVGFPVGTEIEITQVGAGQATITAGAGVTLRAPGGALKTSAQYATAKIRKRATNEWVVSGSVVV